MKQIEKLDLILKSLYEKPGKIGEVVQLLKEKGVDVTFDDAIRLGKRLADAGFVKLSSVRDSALVEMKSEGIEFVEGDSFTHKGQSVISNHYIISNSPNANLVAQSSNVSIVQNIGDIKQTIEKIKSEVSSDTSVSVNKKQEFNECLHEVETGIQAGKNPKFAFKALLELASDFASVGSLVIELGKLTGLIMTVG